MNWVEKCSTFTNIQNKVNNKSLIIIRANDSTLTLHFLLNRRWKRTDDQCNQQKRACNLQGIIDIKFSIFTTHETIWLREWKSNHLLSNMAALLECLKGKWGCYGLYRSRHRVIHVCIRRSRAMQFTLRAWR